jgi:hypothetical protein
LVSGAIACGVVAYSARRVVKAAEFVAGRRRDVVARRAALADLGSVAVGVIGDRPRCRVRRHALQAAQAVVGKGLIVCR